MEARFNSLIEALNNDNPGVESIALWKDGEMKRIHRYTPKKPRLIYSHTKSFVATAVGIAIDEGKLTLDTKIIDLFPEYLPYITDERVKDIKLSHLLTMSSGFGSALLMSSNRRRDEGYPDYVGFMLKREMKYAPGEKFVYSNADTHLCGCMVQRATGTTLLKYAHDKIFAPLDMGFPAWETDPDGVAFGGSGLYLDITDMMKLGILYLNKGVWNGERVVSEKWVELASSKQIHTGHEAIWNSEYGFQFWLIGQQEGAYRADGAFGQFSIVLPKENAVIASQCCEENDVPKFVSMIQEHIF
ncbi:MAG: serine hydrolase [Clostridia bacterium]|nr:serine hydrolase [Clostridia bacterium]